MLRHSLRLLPALRVRQFRQFSNATELMRSGLRLTSAARFEDAVEALTQCAHLHEKEPETMDPVPHTPPIGCLASTCLGDLI
jgi:hypothetical protein